MEFNNLIYIFHYLIYLRSSREKKENEIWIKSLLHAEILHLPVKLWDIS